MMKKQIIMSAVLLFVADLARAALTWTGAGDGESLFQEANWLDTAHSVPAGDTINPNTAITALTGGLVEISSGSGSPNNFNGDFILASGSGDDLMLAGGKVLAGNGELTGGGIDSLLTISGSSTTINVETVSKFDSIVVTNHAELSLKSSYGISMQRSSSIIKIADGSSVEAQYIVTGDRVDIDGTSSLKLNGSGTPINGIDVHMEPGAQLTLHNLAEFSEQGSKIFVGGLSYSSDNAILSFEGITATAVAATVPFISGFSASPDSFSISGDTELNWQTDRAGWLEIAGNDGVITSYTASADGQAALDSGRLVISNIVTNTSYTLSTTLAEDGSGEVLTAQAIVTVIVPVAGTDTDRDGIPDLDEISTYLTDPNERDTDGDGTPDGQEIENGVDPNNPAEYLERPNIIFFFCDDLGYGDLGCFWQDQLTGSQKFDTPHLDTMAADGAKLTHHYVAAPVCAPTRASLLQGRHQGHADVRNNEFDKAIPDNHTMAGVLQGAGYRTIHVGKNGVAGGEGSVNLTGTGSRDLEGHPLKRGFDEFFGYLFHADGHEHFPRNGASDKRAFIYDGYRQVTDASLDLYSTDAWTAYAKKAIVEEVQDGDNQPFFLYVAYETPHFKMQRPAVAYPAGGGQAGGVQWTTAQDGSGLIRYASTADGTGSVDGYNHPENNPGWTTSAQQHVGMIRRIDNSVADILTLLEDLEIDENTLIVFTSDNGPHSEGNNPRYFESYANMEGTKRDMLEAGIRVPTIVKWPGMIDGATGDTNSIHEIAYPGAIWDWMPTFAEMAQVPAPAWCDGVSLLPTLTGRGAQRDKDYLYFEYYHSSGTPNWSEFPNHRGERRDQMQCIRIGDYMGIRTDIAGAADEFEIYNVVTDPGQGTDLAGSMPKMHQRMKDIALQGRRVSGSAARPYDAADVPNASRSVDPGLSYSNYEGIWSYVPELRDLAAVSSGTVTSLDLSVRSRDDHFGLLFEGYIDVPAAGDYTFTMSSDSGANLFIHDAHVIDDDFNHDGSEQSGSVKLAAGLHPIRLYYRHGKADTYTLDLKWEGPGITKAAVPSSVFFQLPTINVSIAPSAQDLMFSWNSTTGQTYRLRSGGSLQSPRSGWTNEVDSIVSTPPENSIQIVAGTGNSRFYIVEEEEKSD